MKKVTLTTYNTLLGGLESRNRLTADVINFFYFIVGIRFFLAISTRKTHQVLNFSVEESPDIVVVTEIPTLSDRKLARKFFSKAGHKTIVNGTSKYFKKKDMELSVIIASKFRGRRLTLPSDFVESTWGSCAVFIKRLNTVVIGVHMSVFKENRKKEFELLKEIIKEEIDKRRKVIVAGDFNTHSKEILTYFEEHQPQALNIPTFSHWLMPQKALDNVLVFGGTHAHASTASDSSDHKKIYSEIRL